MVSFDFRCLNLNQLNFKKCQFLALKLRSKNHRSNLNKIPITERFSRETVPNSQITLKGKKATIDQTPKNLAELILLTYDAPID